ncbi:MAG: hypothetical protein JXR64_12800 [Spirochaetales bacterium]|nr:hypothetical protein [Spirochaetales bacterium]
MKVIEFNGDGTGSFIKLSQIDNQKLTWININLTKFDEDLDIPIPELAFASLTADDIRPRIVEFQEGLVLIFRGVNSNPGREPNDMVSLRVWFSKNLIVTFRKQTVKSLLDIENNMVKNIGPKTSSEFLVMLTNSLVNRIEHVVSIQQELIDDLDEILIKNNIKDLKDKIPEYRLDMIRLRRHLFPLRETFAQLLHQDSYDLDKKTSHTMYEHLDTLIRCIEDLDSSRERCTVIQEQLNTKLNEQMNKSIYSMSIIATIFLPLSLFTGLLGINVGGMPGVNSPIAFAIVCVVLIIIAIFEYIFFKRKMFLK